MNFLFVLAQLYVNKHEANAFCYIADTCGYFVHYINYNYLFLD